MEPPWPNLLQNLTLLDIFVILALSFVVDLVWGLIFRASVVACSRARPQKSEGEHDGPPISVIIPCHNSEDVIDRTLKSIMSSGYPNLELIVVDDASTNGTYNKVASYRQRVTLLHKSKSGRRKTEAVNFGIPYASSEIIVVIDDDTEVAPGAFQELLRPLRDERVAAAGGNVKVRTYKGNLLTKLQDVEYMVSMELGRSFQTAFYGGAIVISGCFGAFRRGILKKIGQYDPDTITEDLDLTWKIYRLLGKVAYSPNAVCYTETPRTLRALLRQRTRWDRGLLETLAKHRGIIFDPKIGRVKMLILDTLIFEFALLFARPLWVVGAASLLYPPLAVVALVVGFYIGLEAFTVMVAGLLSSDKRNALKMTYAPLMFIYRQLLGLIRIRATILYLLGSKSVW
ncbi:MAG: glycosyltransferase family 2 protein [Candidatus Bathyarchaeia archaeon]